MQTNIKNMTPSCIKLCAIFVFGIFVTITESNVFIDVHGVSDTNGRYACNTSVVLTCEITGYTDSMEWRVDGDIKSECFLKACNSYPPFPGHYSFTNDIADSGISIFNLTIDPLALSDRGKSFVCTNGTLNANITLQVTAKNDDYGISYTDNQFLSYMDASTGCLSSDTKVKFTWRKIKELTNETSVYENDDEVELPCTSSCIDSGIIKRKSTLDIKGDDYGDRFRFQVEVIYENASHNNAVYNFGTTYILKGPCSIKCDKICILLIVIGVCFFIDVIVGCSLLYVKTKKDDSTETKMDTSHIEIILNTVSTIMWIVIVILFIWALLHCCSCDDPCSCCKIVLKLRIVIGILFGIHVILWLILLYVLYNRKGVEDAEGNIYFKTKLRKVRIVFSTIPMVGFFPVCGWLIRIYRYGKRTISDKVTSEKKIRKLPSIPERIVTLNKTEDKKNKCQKKVKKEQNKIDELFKQTIDLSEEREEKVKEDQLSASEITIVKPKGTYIKSNANIQKSADARSTLTHSVTKQQSQNNRNVLTRSQDHTEEHEKNMLDNQNHGPHSDEKLQRKIDVTTKQSGSKKKSDNKDEVKPRKKKSRKETDENKSTKTTEFIITDASTGNTQVTKRGYDDPPDSRVDGRPSNIYKSDKAVPRKKKSRKNNEEKEGPNNTKPLSAESHNGSETMKRALSANFDDKYDSTTTVSIDSDTKM